MYCANLETIITGNDSGIISDLIKQVSQMDFVPGRKDLIKDLAFANFDSCRTELTENRKPEFHKDFLDVHIIVNGCESIFLFEILLRPAEGSWFYRRTYVV